MKRSILISLGALALAFSSSLTLAQTTPPAQTPPASSSGTMTTDNHAHFHRGHEHRFMRVLHQLNLTADQKTQIHSIFEGARPQMESLGKSTRENMEQLMSTPPGDAAYSALVESAKSNAVAHIKLITDTQAQIYAVLTPEQQGKIPAIVAAEKAKREAAKQKWQAAHEQPAAK
jgi:Spy/CpxP family protein refolding chaperone